MKRIGILGGTFNPIHNGHLLMGQVAYERLKLDEVIFVPSYLPPHKTAGNVIAAAFRYQMVKIAVKGIKHFTVLDYEVKRKKKSYTIDTLKYLHKIKKKRTKIFFIIGEDSAHDLPQWKNIDEIVRLASFVVFNRPGSSRLKSKYDLQYLSMPGLDISSSFIREQIRKGRSSQFLIPDNVLKYIKKHRLYS